jgi:hypothetical protein
LIFTHDDSSSFSAGVTIKASTRNYNAYLPDLQNLSMRGMQTLKAARWEPQAYRQPFVALKKKAAHRSRLAFFTVEQA